MKHLRKQTKSEKLLEMFPNIGDKCSILNICKTTGIKNYNSLKAFLTYIRKAPHIPETNRVDIRIDGDTCMRVK